VQGDNQSGTSCFFEGDVAAFRLAGEKTRPHEGADRLAPRKFPRGGSHADLNLAREDLGDIG
jgi:hypothetical protein